MNESTRTGVGASGRILAIFVCAAALAVGALAEISIVKFTNGQDANATPGPILVAGDPVTWTYQVTAGSRDATNIVVTDDQGVPVSCPASTLAASQSMTCTATGVATVGQYTNLGTVAAVESGVPVSASDPSHYFGVPPGLLALQKSTNGQDADAAPGPVLAVGDPVTWTYEVTNTGTDPITAVTVSDDQGVAVSCPTDTLAPGASMTCTASGTAQAGQYANLGIVQATHPTFGEIAATDPSHYFGQDQELDFGDAPDSYGTSLAGNGARHLLGSNVFLGACADAELDGAPSPAADGDDAVGAGTVSGSCAVAGVDEDGVSFATPLVVGQTAGLTVSASAPCTLGAWIDFGADGSFAEAGDALFPAGSPLVAGSNSRTFTVPLTAEAGPTFARFRCTTEGAVGPLGSARDGEVEDYAVEIVPHAEVAIAKSAAPDPVGPGSDLVYTLTVTNAGPAAAAAVEVADTIPAGTGFVSLAPPAGWTCTTPPAGGGGAIDCAIASLPPGSVQFTLIVAVAETGAPPTIDNTATATASTLDLLPGDNSASVSTEVRDVVPIPTLDGVGLLAFAAVLAGVATLALGRAPSIRGGRSVRKG